MRARHREAALVLDEAQSLSPHHACMVLCLPAMGQEHVLLVHPPGATPAAPSDPCMRHPSVDLMCAPNISLTAAGESCRLMLPAAQPCKSLRMHASRRLGTLWHSVHCAERHGAAVPDGGGGGGRRRADGPADGAAAAGGGAGSGRRLFRQLGRPPLVPAALHAIHRRRRAARLGAAARGAWPR